MKKNFSCERMIVTSECLARGTKPLAITDESEYVLYFDRKHPLFHEGSDYVQSNTGELFPIETCRYAPGIDRLTIFIPGNPGAGKSYYAARLIERFPIDTPILLFTSLDEHDSNFDDFRDRIYKVSMTVDNLCGISVKGIRSRLEPGQDVIALFDDIDKIADKKTSQAVFNLLQDLLANGRVHDRGPKTKRGGISGNIHVIATTHSMNDFLKTKYLIENCNYVAVFPQSTLHSALDRLLTKIGMSKEDMETVRRCGERIVLIHKTAPLFMIAADQIMLLT